MRPSRGATLLLDALARPAVVTGLDLRDWETLIDAARQTRLLARLGRLVTDHGLVDALPPGVAGHLQAAMVIVDYHQRRARWELNRLRRVLSPRRIPMVVLKGGAYLVLGLDIAQGREMRDIDLLIPASLIEPTERLLLENGWVGAKLDDYDQRYYREWMHELPPMRHAQRVTEVDLHHTILPRTSRLHPDPVELFRQARPLPEAGGGLGTLSPTDMVLHSAVHLFHDGALDLDLRDLVDLDALFRAFATEPAFWPTLLTRAQQMQLTRPLYYAIHFARRLLATPIPDDAVRQLNRYRPAKPIALLMDQLVPAALLPSDRSRRRPGVSFARWLLYLRSHWLRMPPLMLARHLFHKGVISKPKDIPGLF